MITIGQLIKKYRKEAGLTSEQLAEMIGVTQGTISQLETDKREPKQVMFKKIIKALNIPREEAKNIKTRTDDFLDKPLKSTTVKFHIGITEMSCAISADFLPDIDLDSYSSDIQESFKKQFEYISPIYMNAIAKVLINNKKQIDEQIKIEMENKMQIISAKIENQNNTEE